jgi:capsular exopolysaccharide synthesis family protein
MRKRNENFHSDLDIDLCRVINEKTPFDVREAYSALYTNVRYLPIKDKCRKIAVTSYYPGEGKSLVSLNLAKTIAIASPESRVLVVDLDMRCPRLASLFEIKTENPHGMSEYLANIDAEPNFINTSLDNFFVITSGAKTANALGLLSSSRLKSFFEYCEDKFDYVIVDTPPVKVVSDAVLLSDHINGYVLAVRADYSDINGVSDAVNILKSVNGNIFGTVLTSYNTKDKASYGKYSRYGRYGKYSRYVSK